MSNKRTTISIQCTDQQVAMIEALKNQTGMPTRSGVMMFALAQAYAKSFPSYSGKPTPIQAGSNVPTVVAKAKARVVGKQIQNEEEMIAKVDSGKTIARLLSATITNEADGIAHIGMRVERLDNAPVVSELATDIKLVDIPHTIYLPLKEDTMLQAYLLNMKFRDLDPSAKPELLKKKLTKVASTLVLAIDRDKAKPSQFSMEVLELLIAKMKDNGVKTKELEQTLLESGFMERYAT